MTIRIGYLGLLLTCMTFLSACGGGGGGGDTPPQPPPPPIDTTLDWDEDNWDEKDWA